MQHSFKSHRLGKAFRTNRHVFGKLKRGADPKRVKNVVMDSEEIDKFEVLENKTDVPNAKFAPCGVMKT